MQFCGFAVRTVLEGGEGILISSPLPQDRKFHSEICSSDAVECVSLSAICAQYPFRAVCWSGVFSFSFSHFYY